MIQMRRKEYTVTENRESDKTPRKIMEIRLREARPRKDGSTVAIGFDLPPWVTKEKGLAVEQKLDLCIVDNGFLLRINRQ